MNDKPCAESRLWGWAVALAAALGVALRIRALLAGRSLWLDEAMLALNICGRSFAGLLAPLDYHQGAPIGFLMLERLAVVVLGPTELALRLVPFLASIATLGLVYWFCRANFGISAAAIGVALASLTPDLISYSGEAKQYGIDVTVGLLVVTLGANALRLGLSLRRALILAAVGALAVWFSHPAVFVLAGVGTTIILKEIVHRRPAPTLLALGTVACWLASFAVIYFLSLRDLHTNSHLHDFWESGFLTFPPASMNDLRQYVVVGLGIFEAPFQNFQLDESISERMAVMALAAWLTGVVMLVRRGERGLVCLLAAPLAFALLAAVLHRYPLRYRLALFTAGPILLTMSAGFTFLLRPGEGSCPAVGRVLLGCLFALPAMQAAQLLLERPRPYGARTVLEQVARDWRPGDLLLVDACSEPSFHWYQTYGHIAGLDRVAGTLCPESLTDAPQLVPGLPAVQGRSRVWVVVSDHIPDRGGRAAQVLRLTLDQWGERLGTVTVRGYYAYLYDFRAGFAARRMMRGCARAFALAGATTCTTPAALALAASGTNIETLTLTTNVPMVR